MIRQRYINQIIVAMFLCLMNVVGLHAVELDDISFKGDLRLRYQGADRNDDDRVMRSRARIRARLGTDVRVNDSVKVYAGLASGGSDARSTNQTLDSANASKSIVLDYSYARFNYQGADILAGKMKNPLWRVSDLMWDSDIRPEGVAVTYGLGTWSLLGSYFILDEESNNKFDPHMMSVQVANTYSVMDASLKTAVSAYQFNHVEGWDPDGDSDDHNAYTHNPMVVSVSSTMSFKDMMGLPYLSFFGDFLQNTEETSRNRGALAGVKFGDKKVKTKGQWQGKVQYRHLGRDAVLDIFPDSDAYGGATGVKGVELIASYGLAKNTVLTLDYYVMESIEGDSQQERLFQTDIGIKF